MFLVQDIPVVIEPGVAVLETKMAVEDSKAGLRTVAAHFFRLALDEKSVSNLPMVVTTQQPHVFSMNNEDADQSPLLLVYDQLGRLSVIYTRDDRGSWERKSVADEHAGKSITQFSVRYSFGTVSDRDKFVGYMKNFVDRSRNSESLSQRDMLSAMKLLSRSRVAPVVLPVAIDKSKLRNVRV